MAYKVPPKIPTFTAGPHFARQIVIAAIGIACVMFAWTSFYTVPAESQGVVLRFGKLLKTVEPGLHFKVPLGIDTKTILPTRRQLKVEFGFGTAGYSNPDQVDGDFENQKSMVTGDLNSVLVEWIVQYRIADPTDYLFQVREPGQTLRDLSETAMREVIGDRTVDEVITIGRQDIETTALARMQDLVKLYNLGIRVNHYLVVDFAAFITIVDSLGGIDIEVPYTINRAGDKEGLGRVKESTLDTIIQIRHNLNVMDSSTSSN